MKNLAQFKKDLKIDDVINLISFKEDNKGVLLDMPIPEKLQGDRKVTYIDTTGFYLKGINNNDITKGSFCGFPKASNLKYDGDTFTIQEKDDERVWQQRIYKLITNTTIICNYTT